MVQFFSLTQPSSGPGHASKTGTSLFASAVGKVYMLESAEPEDRAVESIFVAAPSGPAVCEPPHDPQNAVLLSSRAHGSEPPAVDFGPEPSDTKLRSFVDARKAVKARHLSRGFYPFSPGAKGFRKGKHKGKGKGFGSSKGKMSKGSTSPSSPSTSLNIPILMTEGSAYAIAPGQPGYSGCFIRGDRLRHFRDCSKRSSKRSSKGSRQTLFVANAEAFMVQEIPSPPGDAHLDALMGLPYSSSSTFPLPLAQDSFDDLSLDGFAVLDSGATETVSSLPALESLMQARFAMRGRSESVVVTDTPPKRLKFGNGAHDMSASHVLLPLTLGQREVPMGVFTLDVQGVPLLIGIKALRRLHAVLDCHYDVLVLGAIDASRGVKLRCSLLVISSLI